MVKIDLSDTRVSPEGLSLLLACHPNLVKIGHKETFHAFQLIQQQCLNSEEKFALKYLSSCDVHLTPDRFEYVLENTPGVESVSLTSAGMYASFSYRLLNGKIYVNRVRQIAILNSK